MIPRESETDNSENTTNPHDLTSSNPCGEQCMSSVTKSNSEIRPITQKLEAPGCERKVFWSPSCVTTSNDDRALGTLRRRQEVTHALRQGSFHYLPTTRNTLQKAQNWRCGTQTRVRTTFGDHDETLIHWKHHAVCTEMCR